jgi:transcriptional regulator with XRE-family HTH domain
MTIKRNSNIRSSAARAIGYLPKNGTPESLEAEEMAYRYRRAIGGMLRSIREEHEMTQQHLADLLGMTDGGVSAAELGRQPLNPERVVQIADIFNLNREEWGKFVLQFQNPWIYGLIYGARKLEVKDALRVLKRAKPTPTPTLPDATPPASRASTSRETLRGSKGS